MCNLYPISTNQAAIMALFRVVNPFVKWLRRFRSSEKPRCRREILEGCFGLTGFVE